MRIEIAAALAAADGQCCQAVLENLFKSEELENAEIYGRVESEAALVRADRSVELDTVASVDAGLALIINPGNTELNNTLRFYQSFQKRCCFVLGSMELRTSVTVCRNSGSFGFFALVSSMTRFTYSLMLFPPFPPDQMISHG